MIGKNGGKNLRDQAQELVGAVAPHVGNARGQLGPMLEELRDQLDEAREQLVPRLEHARDELAPKFEQARDQLVPMLADVREKAAPHVAEARERLVTEVVPTVKAALEEARVQAGPYAEEARRRGMAAAAALAGHEPEPPVAKRSAGKWVLVLGGVAAAAAVAWKRLMGGQGGSWQSSYTPAPPAPPSPAGEHVSGAAVDSPSTVGGLTDDEAGGTPGEALADATEGPTVATTPDDPADVAEAPGPEETGRA